MTSKHTILIVDDEKPLADGYAAWLSDEYDVRTAYSGSEALDEIDDSVDVVLLDRRMPTLSGDELLAEINERGLSCRVALVSAVEPDFDVIELGYDLYVEKPLTDAEELKAVVNKLLRRSTYDSQMQTFLSLASKIGSLQAKKTEEELAASEEYRQLREEFDDVRERLSSTTIQLDEDDLRADFHDRNIPDSDLLDVRSPSGDADRTDEE